MACSDHQHCIDTALKSAEDICLRQKARLTTQRREILQLVWKSHRPLGAYTLIDELSAIHGKKIAPPTVYRALDFLIEMGLIHRINSLNAYIGCPDPKAHDQSSSGLNYFFICKQCHDAQEIINDPLSESIETLSLQQGFKAQQQWLEVTGVCQHCQ